MVHALGEIRRVLAAEGVMIDLRPLMDRWPVEVVSSRGVQRTGRLIDLPAGLEDDEAANRVMAEAEAKGWFIREQEDLFPFYCSWDTPREMEEYIEEEWQGFLELDERTRQDTRSAWAVADADSRIQIPIKMLITRWKKQPEKGEFE